MPNALSSKRYGIWPRVRPAELGSAVCRGLHDGTPNPLLAQPNSYRRQGSIGSLFELVQRMLSFAPRTRFVKFMSPALPSPHGLLVAACSYRLILAFTPVHRACFGTINTLSFHSLNPPMTPLFMRAAVSDAGLASASPSVIAVVCAPFTAVV